IHRRIGMSGGLLVNALLRETGRPVSPETARPLQRWHAEAYQRQIGHVRPLPGASWDLLATRRARALGLGLLSGGYGQDYGACQTPRTVDRERRLARFSQLNLDMCIWHKSAHVYETCVHLLTDTSSIRRHDCGFA
ncbi:MAG: hypothetical protein ACXVZQ_04150, partial [Terriglobales bacterium]